MAVSLLDLCNQALSAISKGRIGDLTENSLEAKECLLHADDVLEEVSDWTHWHFLTTSRVLALVTNDREAEWLYAYDKPDNMVEPLYIRGVEDAATSLPQAGPHTLPVQDIEPLRYHLSGDKIYSNTETATLFYTRPMTVEDLTPLVRRAYVLELAARISPALTKNAKLTTKLQQDALAQKYEAMADEENKQPRSWPEQIPEAEYARMGIGY